MTYLEIEIYVTSLVQRTEIGFCLAPHLSQSCPESEQTNLSSSSNQTIRCFEKMAVYALKDMQRVLSLSGFR